MGVSYEIVLVDDRARDSSWPVIEAIAAADPHVRGMLLSRNHGQQLAITAGLSEARGQWIVVMDCDLQEPPEEIPLLHQQARAGCDIVYAKRQTTQRSLFRVGISLAYNSVLRRLSGLDIDPQYGALSMISRRVRDEFMRFGERDRHYLHVLKWLGFKSGEIVYRHQPRHAGRSSYSVGRLWTLAFDGLLLQTTKLLRVIVYSGFINTALGLLLSCALIYHRMFVGTVEGWTSVTVLLLLVGGMLMTSIGVCGLYIGKIFEQVIGRPMFVVDKTTVGVTQQRSAPHTAAPVEVQSP